MLPVPPNLLNLDVFSGRPDDSKLGPIGVEAPDAPERFADAYEQQVGYLSKIASEEERRVQLDITYLRGLAYNAQRTAADYQAKTDAARRALSAGALSSWALRDEIQVTRAAIDAEVSALQASRASIQQEEAAAARLRASAREEATELSAKCEEARMRRYGQEEQLAALTRELQAVRSERLAEQQVAEFHKQRAAEAAEARENAIAGLAGEEQAATFALQQKMLQLQAEFAQERADFQKRDNATAEEVRELERQLDLRRTGACRTGTSPFSAQQVAAGNERPPVRRVSGSNAAPGAHAPVAC